MPQYPNYNPPVIGGDPADVGVSEASPGGVVYTEGTIGDLPLPARMAQVISGTYVYDDGYAYTPRLRTVQTRVFRTDGLPGDDGWNFQASQLSVIE